MSEIQIADNELQGTVQLRWKCDSCNWSFNYFDEPAELRESLLMAMRFAVSSHKCSDEKEAQREGHAEGCTDWDCLNCEFIKEKSNG